MGPAHPDVWTASYPRSSFKQTPWHREYEPEDVCEIPSASTPGGDLKHRLDILP